MSAPRVTLVRAARGASLALVLLGLLGAVAPVVAVEPPYPVRPTGSPFPGSGLEPLTARQAAMALADYWLGDDAYVNPAGALGERGVTVTPVFQRANRQDLAAVYRQFDEQTGAIDMAAVQLRAGMRNVGLAVYWSKPLLRDENQAYLVGDITTAPSVRNVDFAMMEQRVGVAAATSRAVGAGTLALGLGGEWFQRKDHYDYTVDTDGFPPDPSTVEFDGDSWAGQLGARWDGWADGAGASRLRVGAAWRYAGKLPLEGTQSLGPLSGDTTIALSTRRPEVNDFGLSARALVSTGLSLCATLGRRGEQDYGNLGGKVGPGALWSSAIDYHDPTSMWGVWFGLGQDQMDGNPEPRASLLGLGFDVRWKESSVAIGAMRRSTASDVEPDGPRWYAYRILASLDVRF